MNIRNLKVETTGDFYRRKVKPAIRLKGNWLARAGFLPDSHAQIILRETGVLEIRALSPTANSHLPTYERTHRPLCRPVHPQVGG